MDRPPPRQLIALDDHVLTVTGTLHMPLGDFARRMTVVRLSDGRLVIHSAIALDEDEMRALESFGAMAFLIVPHDRHRLDAKPWKDRYPAMKVIAPAGARKKVEEVVPVDATTVDFGDPKVRFVTVPGTDEHEAALLVEGSKGTTLVLNELVFNVADRPGFRGWLFKTLGMTGKEPHIPPAVKLRDVKDKAALRAKLATWARLPNLSRIVVSHGDVIANDAPSVLVRIAEELAA